MLNLAFWLIVGWTFTRFHLPGNSLFFNAVQNSGHGIAFFVITAVALWSVNSRESAFRFSVFLMAGMILMIGVGIEFAQALTGRGASYFDLLMNTTGVTAAYCIYVTTHTKNRVISTCALLVAAALISWWMYKPARYFVANLFARPLPVLLDFEPIGSMMKVSTVNATATAGDHSSIWMSNSSRSLKVEFHAGRWPSVKFLEPDSDWSEYDQLTFQVMNVNPRIVPIRIRVDDASIDNSDHAFMTVHRNLDEGLNTVSIPLYALANDAVQRGIPTFEKITGLTIFVPRNEREVTLVFDGFLLR